MKTCPDLRVSDPAWGSSTEEASEDRLNHSLYRNKSRNIGAFKFNARSVWLRHVRHGLQMPNEWTTSSRTDFGPIDVVFLNLNLWRANATLQI